MSRRICFFTCLLVLLVTASCARTFKWSRIDTADSADWRSFRRDGRNAAYDPSATGTPTRLLWRYDAKRPLKSSPIIIGGMAVVGSLDKRVHFLDAFTGRSLGFLKLSSPVATTACAESTGVYFGTDTGKETFLGFDLISKRVVWKKRLGDVTSSPIIHEDRIFVGSANGRLRALERTTGRKIWEFDAKASIFSTPAYAGPSPPSSDQEMIYFGSTDGYLYALKADSGQIRWKFKAEGGVYSSPAVSNGMIFFGSVDGNLYALNSNDGSLVWKFQTESDIYSSPAVTESLVYIGSNDHCMYAVNQKMGQLVWKFKTEGLVHSSPVAVGDKLFFGSYDGNFYVLNRFTGEMLWKYQTDGMISGSPAYYEGKLYITSEDGFLYCFGSEKPTP
ncbi:MAG: PQQ-binding-like beta-propeller repeat protein [Candidatus Zixiibacteriota bacterium]